MSLVSHDECNKSVLLLYHFMAPDKNVSAQHFSQLGQMLSEEDALFMLGHRIERGPVGHD